MTRTTDRRRPQPRKGGRHELYNAPRRRGRNGRSLAYAVLVAVIFAGMFTQIFMLAQVWGQQKQIDQTARRIRELRSEKENMEVALSQYKRLDGLSERAAALGMVQAEPGSIRLVNVIFAKEPTNAQTALAYEDGGNE